MTAFVIRLTQFLVSITSPLRCRLCWLACVLVLCLYSASNRQQNNKTRALQMSEWQIVSTTFLVSPSTELTTAGRTVLTLADIGMTTQAKLDCTDVDPDSPTRPAFLPRDWTVESNSQQSTRRQAVLHCHNASARIIFQEVQSEAAPFTILAANDTCLKRIIQTHCSDDNKRVPRVAHYVWFSPGAGKQSELQFFTLVSIVSVLRFLQPCLVLVHGDSLPSGPYWLALLRLVPNIVHVRRERPRQIFGHVIQLLEHNADVVRLQALIEYGGVYLDTDQLLLRSFDDLRNNSVVIATEFEGHNCGNALIVSEPGADFLRHWLARYVDFNDAKWEYHSTIVPYELSRAFPHLVHVINSFFRPNWREIDQLFANRDFDLGRVYALHLYTRFHREFFETGKRLDGKDGVIGDLTRSILYGTFDACVPATSKLKMFTTVV